MAQNTLTIRLGHGIFFYLNGDQIPDPIGTDGGRYDEFEGGNPLLFYSDIIIWAQNNGITHIIDENLLEMGIRDFDNIETPITIREYTELAKSFL